MTPAISLRRTRNVTGDDKNRKDVIDAGQSRYAKVVVRMDRKLRNIAIVLAVIMTLTGSHPVLASEPDGSGSGATIHTAFWGGEKKVDLSFGAVFDKPFYREGYFPWAVLGATIVIAGVLSYATAGAGAPAAATGVSTVASAVGGGGAGSYMVGLSTIGGWFGGNAMVGAAILNGLSLGVGGGGTAWASLSAIAKVGVVASVTATTLDGVLLFTDPTTKELSYRIILPVPSNFGTRKARGAAKDIAKAQADAFKAVKNDDHCALLDASGRRDLAIESSRLHAESAIQQPGKPEHLLVLAILRKNAGDSAHFQQLLERIAPSTVSNPGYLYYLKAILSIENGDLEQAERFLWASWTASPYAIEPAILLVNMLGFRDFNKNEDKILFIVERATKQFDDGDYDTPYSLLALNFRLATQYFIHQRFVEAETYYRRAYKEMPRLTRHFDYFGRRDIRTPVELGIANSLYGQGKIEEADKIVDGLLKRVDTEEEKQVIRRQYLRHAGVELSTETASPVEGMEAEIVAPTC